MDPRILIEAGALGLFVWFTLRLTRQHQNYISSRDMIIAEMFAIQSKRDEENRNFWLQMRGEYNSTLADNTRVLHEVMEVIERNNRLFEELNK